MEACGLPQNGVNWTAAYQLAFKSTRSTKLREFQFNFCTGDCQQVTFGLTLTNKGNPRCSFFFKEEQEKLTSFLELPYNKIFLGNVIARLNCGFRGRSKQFFLADIALAIGLRPASSKLHQHENFCLLRARHCIWLCEKMNWPWHYMDILNMSNLSTEYTCTYKTANQSLPKEWTFLNGI